MRVLSTVGVLVLGMSSWALAGGPLATVNGKNITDQDLKKAFTGVNEGQRDSFLKDKVARMQVVEALVDQEVLFQEAEKSKLDQDGDYKEALNQFRKQYLVNRLIQKNVADKITESGAKKYYESHKTRYSTDQVRAQHILVDDQKKADELLKKAQEKGADFQALAEQNSKDPSAKQNRGDLGFFPRDRMVPEFTEAAFNAKAGEVVGPVKTAFGYHIIKVVERKPGNILSFSEVELKVKSDLRDDLIRQMTDKMKKQAKIEIHQSAIDKL